MFTGIVEEVGEVRQVTRLGDSALIRLRGPLVAADANPGDSVSVNGVCLTVVAAAEPQQGPDRGEFTADVMAETLQRSNLGELRPGDPVDLERALPAHGRLGGHLVQGHVDGTGTIVSRTPGERDSAGLPRWEDLVIRMPERLARYVAEKGSIAVDGVSLTVVRAGADTFSVSLIPTTLAATVLGGKLPGASVNLEVDVIAKYLERLLAAGAGGVPGINPATGPVEPAGVSRADAETGAFVKEIR